MFICTWAELDYELHVIGATRGSLVEMD